MVGMVSTPRRSGRAVRLAFGLAAASLAVVLGLAVTGATVRWTSWALPLLVLGNLALMTSGVERTRPRLAHWLSIGSIGIAAAILAAEVRTLYLAAT